MFLSLLNLSLPHLSASDLPQTLVFVLPLACLVAGFAFTAYEFWKAHTDARVAGGDSARHIQRKRCQYCKLGVAKLTDETVRCEGNSLVEVRCFICQGCGLPQWTVSRSPLTEHVR